MVLSFSSSGANCPEIGEGDCPDIGGVVWGELSDIQWSPWHITDAHSFVFVFVLLFLSFRNCGWQNGWSR